MKWNLSKSDGDGEVFKRWYEEGVLLDTFIPCRSWATTGNPSSSVFSRSSSRQQCDQNGAETNSRQLLIALSCHALNGDEDRSSVEWDAVVYADPKREDRLKRAKTSLRKSWTPSTRGSTISKDLTIRSIFHRSQQMIRRQSPTKKKERRLREITTGINAIHMIGRDEQQKSFASQNKMFLVTWAIALALIDCASHRAIQLRWSLQCWRHYSYRVHLLLGNWRSFDVIYAPCSARPGEKCNMFFWAVIRSERSSATITIFFIPCD